jgi:hypothetical protein
LWLPFASASLKEDGSGRPDGLPNEKAQAIEAAEGQGATPAARGHAVTTTKFMNEWLGTHEDHLISFARRRHTDNVKDPEGDLLPAAAGAPPKVALSLTCLDCHTDILVAIEEDTGQDTEA